MSGVIEAIIRVGLQRFGPWAAGSRLTCATNGHGIVWAPVTVESAKEAPGIEWPKFVGYPTEALGTFSLDGLPELVCRECGNHKDRKRKCPGCNGWGEVECNLGHWHDCEDCEDGLATCNPCDFDLWGFEAKTVQVAGRSFTDRMLSLCLAHIKAAGFTEVKVGDLGIGGGWKHHTARPLTFWVEDGYGATVMPRYGGDDT